jgi:hypothetical protein
VSQATRSSWGDSTPLPAEAPPRIVRRPAWSRVVPALAFVSIGVALIATDLADSPGVVALAGVCLLGGCAVGAIYMSGEVCSRCRRPIDWADGTVPVAVDHTDALREAVESGDTHALVFSLTGVPISTTGDHALIDLTYCKCHYCGTIGASVRRDGAAKPAVLVTPTQVVGPHLVTLAERSTL